MERIERVKGKMLKRILKLPKTTLTWGINRHMANGDEGCVPQIDAVSMLQRIRQRETRKRGDRGTGEGRAGGMDPGNGKDCKKVWDKDCRSSLNKEQKLVEDRDQGENRNGDRKARQGE